MFYKLVGSLFKMFSLSYTDYPGFKAQLICCHLMVTYPHHGNNGCTSKHSLRTHLWHFHFKETNTNSASRPHQRQQDYLVSFSRLDHRFLPSADPHLHTRCNLILCLTSHLFPSGVSHQFPSISSTFPSQYYCYPRRMPNASIIWKRKNWTNQKPKPKQQS